ncbi:rifin PIR protein, putative [Plasmodium reichenowi]|uniref:Rifin PIR protein, putative n=1 Tax=Plasmodium reichenowi TaxID=5854 RepID=A0A2P9DCC5_PLARE|nr:rifin PIR protein, putative [Plasmodium reichenowi]
MKVHYINILLFAFPLNILVSCPKNSYITSYTQDNKSTRTHRLLCECDLYMPNYNNDPEMQKVMENYNRYTSERFKEYDKRMIKSRQKCKEQCDKDIQKILLKDKNEKELLQHFSALETNINTKDIPTCVCKKSMADKMEKTCLKCTQNLGGIVTPSSVVLGGIAELAISVWKPKAIAAAIEAAIAEGAVKGLAKVEAMGFAKFIEGMESAFCIKDLNINLLKSVFFKQSSNNFYNLAEFIHGKCPTITSVLSNNPNYTICNISDILRLGTNAGQPCVSPKYIIAGKVNEILSGVKTDAALKASDIIAEKTAAIEAAKKGAIDAASTQLYTTIGYSILSILIIVLIMMIIYLILRYRRKKKMKKKLQYIKLLTE